MRQKRKLLVVTMLTWPIVLAGALWCVNRILIALDARQLVALGPGVLFALGVFYVIGLGISSIFDRVSIVRAVLMVLGVVVTYVFWTVWDQAGVQAGRVRATLEYHLGKPMAGFAGEYDAWGHSFEKVSYEGIECWRSLGSDRRPGGRGSTGEDIFFCSDGHVYSDNPFVKSYLADRGLASVFGGSPSVLGRLDGEDPPAGGSE